MRYSATLVIVIVAVGCGGSCPDASPFSAEGPLLATQVDRILEYYDGDDAQCRAACYRVSSQPVIESLDSCKLEILDDYWTGIAFDDVAASVECAGLSRADCR